MKRALFLFLTLQLYLNSWSQTFVLQAENRRSGEKVCIPSHTKLELTTINNRYRGELILLSDSLMKIDSNVFLLSDINGIFIPNKEKTTKGIQLLIIGSVGVVTGGVVSVIAELSNFWGTVTNNAIGSTHASPIIGIGMMAAGSATFVAGIVVLASREGYTQSKHHLSIITK